MLTTKRSEIFERAATSALTVRCGYNLEWQAGCAPFAARAAARSNAGCNRPAELTVRSSPPAAAGIRKWLLSLSHAFDAIHLVRERAAPTNRVREIYANPAAANTFESFNVAPLSAIDASRVSPADANKGLRQSFEIRINIRTRSPANRD